MSRGNITRRGKTSWRIKFDIGADPITGKRRFHIETVKGTKKQAQELLTKRLGEFDEGSFVEQHALTVADYIRHWIEAIAPARTSAKTRERYQQLIDLHIIPRIGSTTLQKLDGPRIDKFYAHLRTKGRVDGKGGLAPQTVQHIHRLLSQILLSAVKARKLRQSPMTAVQTTPKVRREEVQVLNDGELSTMFKYLAGKSLYMPVLLAFSTGMRRGEVLALRWKDIDFDRAELRVTQVLEQTKGSISVKEPKTDRSRRTIALPSTLIAGLRQHRKQQAELRLQLGLGKDDKDLVFISPEGEMLNPRNFTKEFGRLMAGAGLAHVTFHGLRHTHITHLLQRGEPIHVVSARAGHANPAVTLNIYSHLLPGQQESAAAAIDSILRDALKE